MPQFPLEEEYKKPTGITPEDIAMLRNWLNTQPHLPGDHITDLDLILTYHCCGRSSEVSKQVLDLHYTLKTLFTSFFKDRLFDDKVKNILNTMLLTVLPDRTNEGYAVYYTYFLDPDPKNFILADAYRASLMDLELRQYEEGTWPGFIMVLDLKQMSLGHFTKLDIQSIQQYLYYLQEAMLVSLKGMHFLNAPPFMDKLLMLIKPFMKKRLMDILHVHQVGTKTLEPYFPMKKLPKGACGGIGASKTLEELRDEAISKIRSNQDFFIEENKKRVVEAKRPGKPKTITDIFGGVDGSFKKLEID